MGYQVMQIEVSNMCSLSCVYCPHPSQVRPKGNMTLETFKKCMELVRRSDNPSIHGKRFVWLNHFGEPLLNPMLPDFIRYAVAHDVEVSFASNGVDYNYKVFSRGHWQSLADAGLRYVIISAHDRSATKLRNHVGDIIDIVSTWQPKRSQLHDWAGQVDLGPLAAGERLPVIQEPCDYESKDMFAVTWDGRIAGCCYDIEGRTGLSIDDVLTNGFRFEPISICSSCRLGRGDAEWLLDPLLELQKQRTGDVSMLSKIRRQLTGIVS